MPFTKDMVVAAQRVAFQAAAQRFEQAPNGDAWLALETEMWAWQRLRFVDEVRLLPLLRDTKPDDWSLTLQKDALAK